MKSQNDGFVFIEVLALGIFLSVVFSAAVYLMKVRQRNLISFQNENIYRNEIEVIVNAIFNDFLSDNTPEAVSYHDPVFRNARDPKDGMSVSIECVSDRMNVNFIDVSFVNSLKSEPGVSFQEAALKLKKMRQKRHFGKAEDFDSVFFTDIGFADINTVSPDSLNLFLEEYGCMNQSTLFLERLKSYRKNGTCVRNFTDYKMFFGVSYEDVWPFIVWEPQINVNCADVRLLEKLLDKRKCSEIVALRKTKEINPVMLSEILGNRKKTYGELLLGTTTSFFSIKIRNKCLLLSVIIGKVPSENKSEEKNRFYILEKKYEKEI